MLLTRLLALAGLAAVAPGCAVGRRSAATDEPKPAGSPVPARAVAPAAGPASAGALPPSVSGPAGATGAGSANASPPAARRPRVALALGGGAARGFAHVGVIEVLEQAGIRIDLVVGTSAGSVVGALYASGMNARTLRESALTLEEGLLGDWALNVRGFLRGRALQDAVNRWVGSRPIERFPIPYAAVLTDLYDGSLKLARSGDAGQAVRASSAVPGLFEPVRIGEREFVDGGLVSPVPVRVARSLGADLVIAVDISAKPRFQETDSLPRVLLQAFAIMSQHLAAPELREADIALAPAVGDRGSADFSDRIGAMALGAQAMRAALPALQQRLRQWRPAS
jgi:NTE family protein